ncbi:hypothetical protein BC832DRAFT_558465 [Gaertneriomyces semiglobifer]|nr:hypothetical protein BC832DRAFT_569542 [Gaertneriomyces semiglobifer]KAI9004069.1 hypothetical protein BC832DRAFT_558465 [Gaertneriomyces semiglobifer]
MTEPITVAQLAAQLNDFRAIYERDRIAWNKDHIAWSKELEELRAALQQQRAAYERDRAAYQRDHEELLKRIHKLEEQSQNILGVMSDMKAELHGIAVRKAEQRKLDVGVTPVLANQKVTAIMVCVRRIVNILSPPPKYDDVAAVERLPTYVQ